jgi:ribosomal protein S18 acetylase RimI-like enzyme
MGRVLGDGGWYFHLVDMAVLPEHQRRGLGDAVMATLLERIRRQAPPGASVSTRLGDG